MNITNKQQRNWLRFMHLVASVGLAMFIYSPWKSNPTFVFFMNSIIFPTVALTGIWMWQAPRISRMISQQKAQKHSEQPESGS